MDERVKVLEMVRDGKVTPEEGQELLSLLDDGSSAASYRILESFVDLHDDDQLPARNLKITSLSKKDGKEKKYSFNLPLGVLRFINGLFPNSTIIGVNSKYLDRHQLMDMIQKGEKGVIYREETDKGGVIIELV